MSRPFIPHLYNAEAQTDDEVVEQGNAVERALNETGIDGFPTRRELVDAGLAKWDGKRLIPAA